MNTEFKIACEARYWINQACHQGGDDWRKWLRAKLEDLEEKRKSPQTSLRQAINTELNLTQHKEKTE